MARKFVAVLLVSAFFAVCCGCGLKQRPEFPAVDEIYVYHSSFDTIEMEYKIVFADAKLWMYVNPVYPDDVPRNKSAKNEGYTLAAYLEQDNIQAFYRDAAKYGLQTWLPHYDDMNIMDGHQWGVEITYADGTQQNIYGSNAYPETWNNMRTSFRQLTGEDIL